MKPFYQKLSDAVRDTFDRYHEEPDPVAFEQFRSKLKAHHRNQFGGPLRYWAAAALVLITSLIAFRMMWLQDNELDFIENDSTITETQEVLDEPIIKQNDPELDSIPMVRQLAAESTPQKADSKPEPKETLPVFTPLDRQDFAVFMVDTTEFLESPDLLSNQNAIVSAHDFLKLDFDLVEIPSEVQARPDLITIPKSTVINDRPYTVTAGSILTFAEGQSATGLGMFAGLTRSWRISDRIKFISGGLLAYNQFEIGIPYKTAYFVESFSTLSAGTAANIDAQRNLDMEYFALDIPLLAQFDLGRVSRSRFHATVGVSSLVYLHQQVNTETIVLRGEVVYDSQSEQNVTRLSNISETSTDKTGALSRTDLGRLMHVSFGITMDFGGYEFLFEPYLKYPLGSLTIGEIPMGMGGVTLKYGL